MTAIYTLTSELHDEAAVAAVTKELLCSIGIDFDFRGSDYSDYGTHSLDLIYVRTGGTEGIFKQLLPELQKKSQLKGGAIPAPSTSSLLARATPWRHRWKYCPT